MILHYSADKIEFYEETQTVGFFTVPVNKGDSYIDILEAAEEKIKTWAKPTFHNGEEQIISSNSKCVKIAILNNVNMVSPKALILNESTRLHLLSDSRKTIREF